MRRLFFLVGGLIAVGSNVWLGETPFHQQLSETPFHVVPLSNLQGRQVKPFVTESGKRLYPDAQSV